MWCWLKAYYWHWRWTHYLYARFSGYFWVPCPVCQRMFGAHETTGSLSVGPGVRWATCPHCPGIHYATTYGAAPPARLFPHAVTHGPSPLSH